jgi:hypothetical protein
VSERGKKRERGRICRMMDGLVLESVCESIKVGE